MKRFFVLLLLSATTLAAHAQQGEGRGSRVQAVKVGYLSERLKLSPEQAERFWPVYNRCSEERRNLRHSYQGAAAPGNRDEAMRQLDGNMEFQEKDLAVRKRCQDEYLKVLSPQQVATLVDAERDFKKMLVDQMRDRRN